MAADRAAGTAEELNARISPSASETTPEQVGRQAEALTDQAVRYERLVAAPFAVGSRGVQIGTVLPYPIFEAAPHSDTSIPPDGPRAKARATQKARTAAPSRPSRSGCRHPSAHIPDHEPGWYGCANSNYGSGLSSR